MSSSKTMTKVFQLSRPLRNHDPSTFLHACRAKSTASIPVHQTQHRPQPHAQPIHPSTRPFSSTLPHHATITKHNPRTDDDGNEMSIIISTRAAKRLRKIVSTPPKRNSLTSSSTGGTADTQPDSHLRVTVTAGGCHGFQYLMNLEAADKIDPEEDTVFEFAEDEGGEVEGSHQGRTQGQGEAKAEVVMDGPSLELLKGSTVDFTTELIGSQFKIVGNPRASSSCGCGTSFDIE